MAARRRRLKFKLGTSLKKFREDVLDEVELQANEAKERQDRLKARQFGIQESLGALRQDLLDEIEEGLGGVKRGSKAIERALGEMRSTWEAEVNALINEARTDVDLAVSDLEEAINVQKEEYNAAVSRFQRVWLEQVPRPRFSASSLANVNVSASVPQLNMSLNLLARQEIDSRISEVSRERERRHHLQLLGFCDSVVIYFIFESFSFRTRELRRVLSKICH